MRILQIVPGIELVSGGPSTAAVGMTKALAKAGMDVWLATTRDSMERYGLTEFKEIEERVKFFPRWERGTFAYSRPFGRWVNEHVANFDIVHVHSMFNYPSYVAATTARKRSIPYIIRPAGSLDPWALGQKQLRKRLWLAFSERHNLRHASALHAVSEREATSLERLGLGSRIAVAPLGVEIPKIDAVARKSHDEPLRLLFLSRIHPKKNLPALLTAMKEVVSDGVRVDLRVVGDADPGEEQYSLSLRRLADDMALAEYITFTGIAGGEEKKREFYRAHVFVLASYEENFGISVVEAMAYGLPVIVSDQVALAHEVARSRAGLVVRCQDVKALAAAIRTLAADENERVDMARRARSLAQRYSWSEVVSGLVSLYGRALNGRLP